MKISIACSSGACTVIRTNNAAGYRPWTHAIPLAYDGEDWQARGSERNASECNGMPAPTSVALKLNVTSLQVANGVWKAQQFMGTYTSIQGPTTCDHQGSSKAVSVVSTLKLSAWPLTANLGRVEKVAGLIWQVVDNGSTVCEVMQCKFAKTNLSKVISVVSKAATIASLAKALQQVVIWNQDTTALIAATKGHVKGTPFSPQAKTLLKKWYRDGYDLQQDIEDAAPGLSLVWHPLPPPK